MVTRRTRYDLNKAEERATFWRGLLIALDNIDEVIRIVPRQPDSPDCQKSADGALRDSPIPQAQAIIDMRLRTLTGLEREKDRGGVRGAGEKD